MKIVLSNKEVMGMVNIIMENMDNIKDTINAYDASELDGINIQEEADKKVKEMLSTTYAKLGKIGEINKVSIDSSVEWVIDIDEEFTTDAIKIYSGLIGKVAKIATVVIPLVKTLFNDITKSFNAFSEKWL